MIARLKKNFHLWGIDNDAVVDFEIIGLHCPICGRTKNKLIIREWRQLSQNDNNNFYTTYLILAYNTPSPRGRLGERRRHNPAPERIKIFDIVASNQDVFAVVVACNNDNEVKFILTRRNYNDRLWAVPEAIHIYEDGCNSCIMWIGDKITELDGSFYVEKIEPHKKCVEQSHVFSVGCKGFIENERVIIYSGGGNLFEFKNGTYEKREIENKLGVSIEIEHIRKFNELSKYFEARINGDILEIMKK